MSADKPEGNLFAMSRKITQPGNWVRKLSNDQFRVLVTIVSEAQWQPYEQFNGKAIVTINRGEVMTSFELLAGLSNVSVRTIRTTLKLLENAQFLTRRSTYQGTILTILNYDRYQFRPSGSDMPSVTHAAPPPAPQPSPKTTTNNKQQSNNEEPRPTIPSSKAEASDGQASLELEAPTPKPSPLAERTAKIEAVYKHYPRKQGKAKGISAALKLIKTRGTFEAFESSVLAMAKGWAGFELDTCPHFSSYVNAKRWEDEVPPLPSKDTKRKTRANSAVNTPARAFPAND